MRTGIARVAKHLDNDILRGTDVVFRLTPLRFRAQETDEAIPEVSFDPKMAFARHVLYKVRQ